MAQAAPSREGKGGISLPAVRVSVQRQPAPPRAGTGSDRLADHGDEARSPSAQALRGRAPRRFEDLDGSALARARALRVRCPVCGKLLQRRSLPSHAFGHIERLARQGVIRLERTDGKWFIVLSDGRKLYGASWLTLVKLIELGVVNSG